MKPWRGLYCEYHNGHILLWGPNGFVGSCRNPQELFGTLERLSSTAGTIQHEAELKTKASHTDLVPSFPANDADREQAIRKWLAENNPTKNRKQNQLANLAPDLSDLGL